MFDVGFGVFDDLCFDVMLFDVLLGLLYNV